MIILYAQSPLELIAEAKSKDPKSEKVKILGFWAWSFQQNSQQKFSKFGPNSKISENPWEKIYCLF